MFGRVEENPRRGFQRALCREDLFRRGADPRGGYLRGDYPREEENLGWAQGRTRKD